MKTLSKRIFAVVLTLAMTLTLTTWASAADFTDMPDNWAKAPLEAAVENGLLNGSDGLLRPTDYLTRAEMAAILVRAFGTTQSASVSGFSDVKADAWYVTQNAVPGAVFMEIMNGNNDGTFEPGRNISREQAFAVLARALKLEAGSSSVLAQFTDAAQISGWASGEVAAMVAAGYVNGSNRKLNPKGNITRQEFAQVMFNIFGDYISTAGTVTELGGKAVMINVPGVTVKDTTVHGDVIIGEGVGEGDVFFENVTIEGRVVVRGGGVNSIHFINSDSSQVLVSKIAGPVRIVADKASSVAEVAVIGGTDAVTVQGSVAKVAVEGDAPVVVKDATVGTVEVSSTAKVELDNAKVTTVAVNASNASVALTNGAAVATVDVAATAAGSTVTGEQGTTITTVKSDVSVTVAGDVKVNKTEGTGSVTDANGDVIATTPTSPSYPIGGGSTGGNKGPEITTPDIEQPEVDDPTKDEVPADKVDETGADQTEGHAHDFSGEPVVTAATCKAFGTKVWTCTGENCSATKTESTAKAAHTKGEFVEETAGDCVTKSVMLAKCTVCQTEMERKAGTNAPDTHKTGSVKDDAAVDATCTTAGKTAGKHCEACKKVTQAQETIPALGHKTLEELKDAAWSKDETNHWKVCGRDGCDARVGSAAHSYGDGDTCTECQAEKPCTTHTWDTSTGKCSKCDAACPNTDKHATILKGETCGTCKFEGTHEHTFTGGVDCSCGAKAPAHTWADGSCTAEGHGGSCTCPNVEKHADIFTTDKCPTCKGAGEKEPEQPPTTPGQGGDPTTTE